MHGYPVMQVVQYSVPPSCSWGPPVDTHRSSTVSNANHGIKKYIIWCLICGGTSSLIGVMFLGVYFLLRSYTSSVAYFETVPTFVPATLLMLTGLCIVSLARRRNRYSYLIKLSGTCGVASALTCALVTVTTTVLHLSRLQTLRQCEYTQKTRTCTCYTVVLDPHTETIINDEARFVFDSTADCGIVHGALYSCLRAIFGLSVAGVLVAVFSCMLVYQLLSHERKKMYWEQLELRCRSLYPEQGIPLSGGPAIIGNPRAATCRCCEQFHCHRNVIAPAEYQWDGYRGFWPPNHIAAHNIIPPNQNRDDIERSVRPIAGGNQRDRTSVGWSWPRMPWQRNNIQRYPQTPSSPDSQYGFSHQQFIAEPQILTQSQSSYGMERLMPYNVWGPPPPYSDPNSPARRTRYQYIGSLVPNQQYMNNGMMPPSTTNNNITEFIQQTMPSPNISHNNISNANCIPESLSFPTSTILKQVTNNGTITDGRQLMNSYNLRDGYSNTLPLRKPKKRIDNNHKTTSGVSQNHHRPQRVNVQNIFLNHNNNSSSSNISTNISKTIQANSNTSNYELQNPELFFNNSTSDIYDDDENGSNQINCNSSSYSILQKYKKAADAHHNHNQSIQYSTIKNYEKPIMDLHDDDNQPISMYRLPKQSRCQTRKLNFNDLSIGNNSTSNDYNFDLIDNNNHIYRNDFNHYYPNTTTNSGGGVSGGGGNHTIVGNNKVKSNKNLNITPIKRNCGGNNNNNNSSNNNCISNNNLTLLMKNFNSSDNSLELFSNNNTINSNSGNNNNNHSDIDSNNIINSSCGTNNNINNNNNSIINNNGNFITQTDDNNNNNSSNSTK